MIEKNNMIEDHINILLQNIWHALENDLNLKKISWDYRLKQIEINLSSTKKEKIIISIGNKNKFYVKTRFFSISYSNEPCILGNEQRNIIASISAVISELENGLKECKKFKEFPIIFSDEKNISEFQNKITDDCYNFLKNLLNDEQLKFHRNFFSISTSGDGLNNITNTEIILRINSQCSMRCLFCLLAEEIPSLEEGQICAIIEHVNSRFSNIAFTISGGEPTLHPAFFDFLNIASVQPFKTIVIQTNGILFADEKKVSLLPRIPNLEFFISFNAGTEVIYDRITQTHGLYPKAVSAIKNLIIAGFQVTINFVITSINIHEMLSFVELMKGIAGGTRRYNTNARLNINFSTVSFFKGIRENMHLLVSYTEIMKEYIKSCAAVNGPEIKIIDIISSGYCNIPLCFGKNRTDVNTRLTFFPEQSQVAYVPDLTDIEYRLLTNPRIKKTGCRSCRFDPYCPGILREYAEKFSLSEIQP